MCGHTKQSLTWHFLLSGLCTGAGRDTPEAHWWTRRAACGLTVEVRMWTRSAGWSATGLRISVLGVGADWSCSARLERSGGHDWLRKCFSGTLWMQKERKVSLSQSGLSEEEEISRREAIIQQQHSLPLMYLLLLSLPREEGCGLQAILVKRGCSVPWYCCWSHLDATSYHNLPRC